MPPSLAWTAEVGEGGKLCSGGVEWAVALATSQGGSVRAACLHSRFGN